MSSSLIGRMLGKYKVMEMLGQGGMATIYKGYQQEIDRYVAIKVLPPHPGLDQQFIKRFKLEARTIARLQHPHILPLYDYGTEDDILYLVMAYQEGGTVADAIERGPMKASDVERILREIASALDYAHRQGAVHRDIKPGNILLDSEGHALLADFGIVKITEGGQNLTGTGVVGTPAYMAPEQVEGETVDARTDIYSLGVVVYEMLTGHQPYSGDTPMQVLIKHMQEPVPNVLEARGDLPPALEYVMQRALAKDPAARYQTATRFAEDFSQAVSEWAAAGNATPPGARQYDVAARNQAAQPTVPAPSTQPQTQPTIVVQSPMANPLVLLGGFAIIAVVIVVAVVLIVGNQNRGQSQAAATSTPPAVADAPTRTQVAAAPTPIPTPKFGNVRFTSSTSPGDTVQLQVQGLKPLASGQSYVAWLVNTSTNETLSLGALTLDAFGTGLLTFVDPRGHLLATEYDAMTVSTEENVSDTPAGEVRYSGSVPLALTQALQQILADADNQDVYTPTENSLLAGALSEAETAEEHGKLSATSSNAGGMHTHAEHTVNILLGTEVDYNGDGRGENPGRKIGVPFYLDKIEGLLDSATSSASLSVQNASELIRVCIHNARGWVSQIVDLEKQMLASDDMAAVESQRNDSVSLLDALINGIDLNQNGVVEPFEGECGLQQIETYGVLVGSMDIVEGSLASS